MDAIVFSHTPYLALLNQVNHKNMTLLNSNQMEKNVDILEYYILSEKNMFWFVAGVYIFEFIVLILITMISMLSSRSNI